MGKPIPSEGFAVEKGGERTLAVLDPAFVKDQAQGAKIFA